MVLKNSQFVLKPKNSRHLRPMMSSPSILREANSSPSKRKRGFPTEDHKLSCVKRMENGESTSRLAKEMGVPPSTLREWKKEYISSGKLPTTPSRPKKPRALPKPPDKPETVKIPQNPITKPKKSPKPRTAAPQVPVDSSKLELMLKIGLNPSKTSESPPISPVASIKDTNPHPSLDEAVFRWFERNRSQGVFISCARLKSEATALNKQLSEDSGFRASEQWLSCWKARYGIRYLPETLEKVTTDKIGEKEFNMEVNRVLKEENLKKCQVFNCCELSWAWKALPVRSTGRAALDHSTRYNDRILRGVFYCGGFRSRRNGAIWGSMVNRPVSGRLRDIRVSKYDLK